MNKIIALGIIIIIVSAGGYVYYTSSLPEEKASTVTIEELSWELTEIGENPKTLAPETRVTLKTATQSYDLGVYSGSCSEIADSSWELVPGELIGVICWWAGAGDEIGVFEENGMLVVKVGMLDEGSAETPGFRGNFQEKIRL